MRHTTIRNAFFATFVLALLAACGGGGSPSGSGGGTSPPPPPPPPVTIDPGTLGDGRMTEILEAVRDRHNLPAFAAVVVSGGQVVDIGASGLRAVTNSAEVTTSDQWHIGSLTKAMKNIEVSLKNYFMNTNQIDMAHTELRFEHGYCRSSVHSDGNRGEAELNESWRLLCFPVHREGEHVGFQ